MRTFAIRMDARKYATVVRLARQRGTTLSAAVREALEGWVEHARTDRRIPYAVLADLVGAVDSQPRKPAAKKATRTRARKRKVTARAKTRVQRKERR